MPSGKQKNHEEFLMDFRLKNDSHNTIEILSKYTKNDESILCRCKECNYEWKTTPKNLLKNHGCPKCRHTVMISNDDFIIKFKASNKNFENIDLLSKYKGMANRINCRCKKCGTKWSPRAYDLLKSGCPSCSGNIRYTHERFEEDLIKKNKNYSNIKLLSKYNGMDKTIKCKCMICKNKWEPIASSLIQGTGCPYCAKKHIAENNTKYIVEYNKNNPPANKITNSEFLEKFKKTPYSSKIKILSEYKGMNHKIRCQCTDCGLTWETMAMGIMNGTGCPNCSHSSTSFMEQYILNALTMLDPKMIIKSRDRKTIGKELDIYIPYAKIAIEIGSWTWHKKTENNDIEKYELCKEKGIELIIIYDSCRGKKPKNKNSIAIDYDLGNEKGYKTLKNILNDICKRLDLNIDNLTETDWKKIEDLAYNSSQRINNERFIELFRSKNPNANDIELLTNYTRATGKIKCHCLKCGYEWETAASELLKGSGCSKCQIKKVGINKRKEKIIKNWRIQNPNGTKLECQNATGISRMTINKWW